MSCNANTDKPCIDCGALNVTTIVQSARVAGRVNHWHICSECAQRFEERKDAFAAEWAVKSQKLRDALVRIPCGQATPGMLSQPSKAPKAAPQSTQELMTNGH